MSSFDALKKIRVDEALKTEEPEATQSIGRKHYEQQKEESSLLSGQLDKARQAVSEKYKSLQLLEEELQKKHVELKGMNNQLQALTEKCDKLKSSHRRVEFLNQEPLITNVKGILFLQLVPVALIIIYYASLYNKEDFSTFKTFWGLVSYYLILYVPIFSKILAEKQTEKSFIPYGKGSVVYLIDQKTGETWYSMSGGGSILNPSLDPTPWVLLKKTNPIKKVYRNQGRA